MAQSISVIIPTFNRARLLDRAIRSVQKQCEAGDEIIVVDDGSTDNTRDVVAAFGDAVRYVPVKNGGAGRARNIGLGHATRPLVAFLDSDDEWFDGKLALQRHLMAGRPDVLFSFTNFAATLKGGSEVRRYLRKWLVEPLPWEEAVGPGVPFSSLAPLPAGADDFAVHIGDISRAEMIDNYVLTSSLVVRREAAGDALRFDESLKVFEDWFCFARLSLKGIAAYLDVETTWQHGLATARLTDVGTLARARAWSVVNDLVWAHDQEFRRRHAARYRQRVERNRLEQARGLIGCGQTREARQMLSGLSSVPYSYKLLSRTPGVLLRYLGAARRRFFLPA